MLADQKISDDALKLPSPVLDSHYKLKVPVDGLVKNFVLDLQLSTAMRGSSGGSSLLSDVSAVSTPRLRHYERRRESSHSARHSVNTITDVLENYKLNYDGSMAVIYKGGKRSKEYVCTEQQLPKTTVYTDKVTTSVFVKQFPPLAISSVDLLSDEMTRNAQPLKRLNQIITFISMYAEHDTSQKFVQEWLEYCKGRKMRPKMPYEMPAFMMEPPSNEHDTPKKSKEASTKGEHTPKSPQSPKAMKKSTSATLAGESPYAGGSKAIARSNSTAFRAGVYVDNRKEIALQTCVETADAAQQMTRNNYSQTPSENSRRVRRLYEYYDADYPADGYDSDSDSEDPRNQKLAKQRRVILNVGGTKFVTYRDVLTKHEGTRLSELMEEIPDRQKFFFDHNADMFSLVLDFYRCGVLHLPIGMCREKLELELDYWRMDMEKICGGCFRAIFLEQEEQEFTNKNLEKQFDWKMGIETTAAERKTVRYRIYNFMDDPKSSVAAWIFGAFVLVCVFFSLVTFILRTVKDVLIPVPGNTTEILIAAEANDMRITGNEKAETLLTLMLNPFLSAVDNFSVLVFTIDIIIRFIVCPRKRQFLNSAMNAIDFACTIPMLITVIIRFGYPEVLIKDVNVAIFYAFMDAAKLARTLRVFRFTTRYSSLRVLVIALRESVQELILLTVFVCTGMVFFATLIYYGEFWVADSQFRNIPEGFWWAVVTMTTVGYGDIHPISPFGYIIGGLCSLCGIVFLALPIPIIGNNFGIYYTYALERKRKIAAQVARERERTKDVKKTVGGLLGKFMKSNKVESSNETSKDDLRKESSTTKTSIDKTNGDVMSKFNGRIPTSPTVRSQAELRSSSDDAALAAKTHASHGDVRSEQPHFSFPALQNIDERLHSEEQSAAAAAKKRNKPPKPTEAAKPKAEPKPAEKAPPKSTLKPSAEAARPISSKPQGRKASAAPPAKPKKSAKPTDEEAKSKREVKVVHETPPSERKKLPGEIHPKSASPGPSLGAPASTTPIASPPPPPDEHLLIDFIPNSSEPEESVTPYEMLTSNESGTPAAAKYAAPPPTDTDGKVEIPIEHVPSGFSNANLRSEDSQF